MPEHKLQLDNPQAAPSGLESQQLMLSEQQEQHARALGLRARNAGRKNVPKQHRKGRMTVWERIAVLSDKEPFVLFQNWGPNLDGASLVTAIIDLDGRKIAVYGHDFTVRAGSVDAGNGRKLARLFELAARQRMPIIGMNDSAGAYVPAGVGGLDGYAEAFTALRKVSGVVPSIMCMFGFNAGGGSYLPRQGSFVIQPRDTFFGLTGPDVVRQVLGEDVTPGELGGPMVHSNSGVVDFVVEDECEALQLAKRLLGYLPDGNDVSAPACVSSDPPERLTEGIQRLLNRAFNSPSGMNTPFEMSILVEHLCDHGDYLEVQALRARNTFTAFARLGGRVVGILANNSMVASGQIDIAAANKNTRFIRFCNLYNIPLVFLEDTTGFLPGTQQEQGGIVQAGRAMLDAIIDVRTPRFLVIVRNAFGGAYASFSNYATGADLVVSLPSARIAVMGPAGVAYVYKDELREIERTASERGSQWREEQEQMLRARYEKELMNADEALSLGSISQVVPPEQLRALLCKGMQLFAENYQPSPLSGPQREFY